MSYFFSFLEMFFTMNVQLCACLLTISIFKHIKGSPWRTQDDLLAEMEYDSHYHVFMSER